MDCAFMYSQARFAALKEVEESCSHDEFLTHANTRAGGWPYAAKQNNIQDRIRHRPGQDRSRQTSQDQFRKSLI